MAFASTTITVSGTPTVFLPLASAWPSTSGCTSNIYLRTPVGTPNTYIAWDPIYGMAMQMTKASCLPPQVTTWWQQPSSSVYTALGPEFQCPLAYSAVQTVVVDSTLRQTLCCPSQYTMLISQPTSAGAFPSQCVSTVTSGQSLTHIVSQGQTDASIVTQLMTAEALVYAIPINGYSIASSSSSSSATTTSASSTSTKTAAVSSPTSSSVATATLVSSDTTTAKSTPAGVYAGIAVGAAGGVALLAVAAWLCFRRRRGQRGQQHELLGTEKPSLKAGYAQNMYGAGSSRNTSDNKFAVHQQSHEVYELPDRYSRTR